ncbi:hypothetical protein BJ170DRAFT_263092 [Xylariales sp. AK1849]|nr:hypothetical protein BJ170DRAFT_263092 [Xylariales sp. AK1849]
MAIETGLPPRYEIRTLGRQHADWCKAIVMHSNVFASPVWAKLYPDNQTGLCYRMFKEGDYLINHQIDSGLSLGIFDNHYQFKSPEAEAAGGKLYWNLGDENVDRDTLLRQMDFPLVSVATAYDSFNAIDHAKLVPLIEVLPLFGVAYQTLAERDHRDPKTWQATGLGQVLFRNATATRVGEEGHGFMKILARYMMRKSAAEGFRGVQIECFHDAVTHVWSNPPEPFRGEVVAKFNAHTFEHKDDKGEVTYTFRPADIDITKVFVTLKS